jgi:hypothetical protein
MLDNVRHWSYTVSKQYVESTFSQKDNKVSTKEIYQASEGQKTFPHNRFLKFLRPFKQKSCN